MLSLNFELSFILFELSISFFLEISIVFKKINFLKIKNKFFELQELAYFQKVLSKEIEKDG